jgi:hypothetical protein
MHTIRIKNIDGYEVITSLQRADGFIDPVATRKVVEVEIEKTDVAKSIHDVKNQMSTYAYQALQAKKNYKDSEKRGQKEKARAFWDEHKARLQQMKDLQDELKPLAAEIKKEWKELTLKHAVYFNLPPGEVLVEDGDAPVIRQEMNNAVDTGKVLTRTMEKIDDYRGQVYWKKSGDTWNKSEISKLGIVPAAGAIKDENLTPAQRAEITDQLNRERIAALKAVDRSAEKNNLIEGAAQDAALMKSRLEIQGDKSALATAQAYYNDKVAEITALYG